MTISALTSSTITSSTSNSQNSFQGKQASRGIGEDLGSICPAQMEKLSLSGNDEQFHNACSQGEIEQVKPLLPSVNQTEFEIKDDGFREALKKGHIEVAVAIFNYERTEIFLGIDPIWLLLNDRRLDPKTEDDEATRSAAINFQVMALKVLLDDPQVDPSAGNNYAIKSASRKGCIEIAKILLKDPRVDPSVAYNYPLQAAAERGDAAMVELLLEHPRVNPSDNGNHAMIQAFKNGHTKVVELLQRDSRFNSLASEYVFYNACFQGDIELLEFLLKDPKIKDCKKFREHLSRGAPLPEDVIEILGRNNPANSLVK